MLIPDLSLTLSQVAWSINFGQEPPKYLLDKLNYLRQLGIPFPKDKARTGSGNRVRYGYEELIEIGIAIFAMNNGMKPGDVTKALVNQRDDMRTIYRHALEVMPEGTLKAGWVKSRGMSGAEYDNEVFLRLHDRYSITPGRIESTGTQELNLFPGAGLFGLVEYHSGQAPVRLVPLTKLALQWTAWALEAPEFKNGPRT
jgi:hypothetical protein